MSHHSESRVIEQPFFVDSVGSRIVEGNPTAVIYRNAGRRLSFESYENRVSRVKTDLVENYFQYELRMNQPGS